MPAPAWRPVIEGLPPAQEFFKGQVLINTTQDPVWPPLQWAGRGDYGAVVWGLGRRGGGRAHGPYIRCPGLATQSAQVQQDCPVSSGGRSKVQR